MNADDLEQQLLLLLDEEDHEIMERGPTYVPATVTSAGKLVVSAHNYNVNRMHW